MPTYSLKEAFQKSFNCWGKKPAITFFRGGFMETELSYAQLEQDANQFAHYCLKLGIKQGDRVIFYIEKSLIAVVAHIALQKIGAVAIPLNPGFKMSEMSYLLDDTEARIILTEPEKEKQIISINPKQETLAVSTQTPYQTLDFFRSFPSSPPLSAIKREDPALIIYTSGTTGKPKGAVLSQQNLIHDAENIIRIWEIKENDVLCHALPLFHVHGLCFALHTALLAGAHILLIDQFNPAVVLKMLSGDDAEHVCNVFMAVPTMYSKLMEQLKNSNVQKYPDFSHLRLLTSGSAPLLVKDFERIKKIFKRIPVEREGMSETGMNFSNPIHGKQKPGSIGLPLPGLKVRIVDPTTFMDVEAGNTGEIWLKGASITKEYWRKPSETKETFVNGWFRTGDLGRVDDDGFYYLTDRIKHIIISGGENVSAKEVENLINTLEGVIETAVVGIPDDNWGEKVAAAIVIKADADLNSDKIQTYFKKNLHKWKCPKEIIFVEKIPKNTMGKVVKEEVKKMFA